MYFIVTHNFNFCVFKDVRRTGKGLNLGFAPDRKAAKGYTEESELVFKSTLVFSVVLTGMIGTSVVIIILNRVVSFQFNHYLEFLRIAKDVF